VMSGKTAGKSMVVRLVVGGREAWSFGNIGVHKYFYLYCSYPSMTLSKPVKHIRRLPCVFIS
jgi:hypothetical protein